MEPLLTLGGQHRTAQRRKSAALTPFKALYPFTARNVEELSFDADDVIEVKRQSILLHFIFGINLFCVLLSG